MNNRKLSLAALLLGSSIGLVAFAEDFQIDSFTSTSSLVLIPQTSWTVTVDSQEISDASTNGCCAPTPGANAIDGNPNTFWNTEWVTNQPSFPHEIVVDLGASYSVAGFRHLPRQDGLINGRLKDYEFFVSDDQNNWGTAIVADTLPNTDQSTDVIFPGGPVTGRYVRLVGHNNYSADGFSASVAELGVWTDDGSPTPTPTATPEPTPTPTATAVPVATATPTPIPTPIITGQPQDQTVNVGQTATFSITATGPGSLSYKWRKNGKPIGGPASNGSSYTTPATSLSDNGAAFTCTVSNGGGSVTSDAAILTVLAPSPTPTASPTPTTTPTPTSTPTATPTPTATATPTPTPTPTATPTATPTPSPTATPNGVPVASISVSPSTIFEGQRATFTISLSQVNPTQSTTVNFFMSGKAKFGVEYTLTAGGSLAIPAGRSSGTVILTALIDGINGERPEKMTMMLTSGAGYNVASGALGKAPITIYDTPTTTSSRHRRKH